MKDGEAKGSPPVVVMGIGGKAEKLVHVEKTKR